VLFIGSSTEAIPLVKAIEVALASEDIALRPWYEGVFEPSSMTLDTLITHAQEADFAVFVFGPDDHIVSRDTELKGPRDNVVFELGLFMGRLERKRAFVISGPMDLKIPSDLAGLTHIRIPKEFTSRLLDAAPGIASQIAGAVKKLGCR
jgi:predicted nucleotide-binding protein